MTEPLWGPLPLGHDRTRFRLWAPACEAVTLEVADAPSVAMTRDRDGWFSVEAPVGPGARYRFRISDDLAVPDPASRAQAGDVHGWSLVTDPNGHDWQNTAWQGRPWGETVLLECHVGLWGGFSGLAERLEDIVALGITAVELMPVNAFSGTRNWGYDGVLPYAPAHAYGSPDALKALIDKAHGLGLMMFLDVVYNHFGPDGNYLDGYCPDFFDAGRHTPWGAAIAFGREAVARFFIDNARMWIAEYRFDGLRFDAVHAIGDDAFLDRLAAEVRSAAGDRHVHLVLENERNDADRLAVGRFDAQWNDDFHNVMHVLLTGETQSYYGDFAERPAEGLARCLAEGFIYQGQASPNHDGAPRGKPSGHLSPTRFVSFLQNHDQIGNRAFGERLIQLTTPERLRAAMALMLLCPQIPLLFMGEVRGSETPFLFFTDFHDELADAVREGRRREFAKFPAFADPDRRAAIPDPNDIATFEASRPMPGADGPRWHRFVRDLLDIRRTHIVPHLDEVRACGAEALSATAVIARWQLGERLLSVAINLGDTPVAAELPDCDPLYIEGAPTVTDAIPPCSLVAWLA